MNLNYIRSLVQKYLNKDCSFIYFGARGQKEKFKGRITKLYPRVFVILTDKAIIKSYSYNDLAINNLKIY